MLCTVPSILCLAAIWHGQARGVGEGQDACQVRAIGVMVNGPSDLQAGIAAAFPTLQEGTTVVVQVTSREMRFLGVDASRSLLHTFTDSTGWDLTPTPDQFRSVRFSGMFDTFPKRLSVDREVVVFGLRTPRLPSKQSGYVQVKGCVALWAAAVNEKAVVARKVSLRKGVAIEAGRYTLTIEAVNTGLFGDNQITFKLSEDPVGIRQIRIYEGLKMVSAGWGGQMGPSVENTKQETVWLRSVRMRTTPVRAIIEVWLWKNLEKIQVPFDLKVGLGL